MFDAYIFVSGRMKNDGGYLAIGACAVCPYERFAGHVGHQIVKDCYVDIWVLLEVVQKGCPTIEAGYMHAQSLQAAFQDVAIDFQIIDTDNFAPHKRGKVELRGLVWRDVLGCVRDGQTQFAHKARTNPQRGAHVNRAPH